MLLWFNSSEASKAIMPLFIMSADFPGHYGFRVYLNFKTQILAIVRFIMIVFSSSLDTMFIISYVYLERLFVGCTVWL